MIRKLRVTGEPIDVDKQIPMLVQRVADDRRILALFLFGSYGTEDQTPLSDVDLAVLLMPDVTATHDLHLELIGMACEALREDDVSVTVLDTAPVRLQFRVLDSGRRLFVRDEILLADFAEQVFRRHGDFMIDYAQFARDHDKMLRQEYGDD